MAESRAVCKSPLKIMSIGGLKSSSRVRFLPLLESAPPWYFVTFGTLHRGAFCQFPFRWIYYYGITVHFFDRYVPFLRFSMFFHVFLNCSKTHRPVWKLGNGLSFLHIHTFKNSGLFTLVASRGQNPRLS